MWIKKNKKQIFQQILINFIKSFILFFLIFLIFFLLTKIFQIRIGFSRSLISNYSDLFKISLFFSIIVTTFQEIPLLKIIFGEQTVICDSCNKVKNYEFNKQCKCGGTYILIEYMYYTDKKNKK